MKNHIGNLALTFLLAASSALAAGPVRDPFPSDYKPHPCAPANACISFARSNMPSAAFSFLGLSLDPNWLAQHGDEMTQLFEPVCRKIATCLATHGNTFLFCNDIESGAFRSLCDVRYPKEKGLSDWEQCQVFSETYMMGVDQSSMPLWKKAQACAGETTPVTGVLKPLDIWIVPSEIPRGYKGWVTVFAIDSETHVPQLADIEIENQHLYAPVNPAGTLQTGYPFRWPQILKRVPNPEGHTDLVAPEFTVKAAHYPDVRLTLPAHVSKMTVEMVPPASKLKPGANHVIVKAHDAESGKPVEARVMVGDRVAGDTNLPIVIELKKNQKRPEIWLTSLFNTYSDVVVAGAAR